MFLIFFIIKIIQIIFSLTRHNIYIYVIPATFIIFLILLGISNLFSSLLQNSKEEINNFPYKSSIIPIIKISLIFPYLFAVIFVGKNIYTYSILTILIISLILLGISNLLSFLFKNQKDTGNNLSNKFTISSITKVSFVFLTLSFPLNLLLGSVLLNKTELRLILLLVSFLLSIQSISLPSLVFQNQLLSVFQTQFMNYTVIFLFIAKITSIILFYLLKVILDYFISFIAKIEQLKIFNNYNLWNKISKICVITINILNWSSGTGILNLLFMYFLSIKEYLILVILSDLFSLSLYCIYCIFKKIVFLL